MTAPSGSKSPTISSIISDIREKKGITGLWSGYSASLILTLNPSLTFFLYEFLKRVMIPRDKRDDPGARITFLLAAVSKAIASSVTYPVSLAKARAQVDGSSSPVKKESVEKLSNNVKDATTDRSKKSAQEAQKHLKDVSKQARKNTIIHSILKIYKEEGIGGLYEGIGGEIIKGFLGHGLTMIVKDRVHELILSLYFMGLRLLKRSPSPKVIISDAREKVMEGGENALQRLKKVGEDTLQSARENGSSLASTAQNSTTTITQSAKDASEKVFNGVKTLGGKTNDSVPTANEVSDRAAAIRNNLTETKTTTTEYVNKEAGHLLGNAGEQLGERIEGLGGEIKRVGKAGNGGQ